MQEIKGLVFDCDGTLADTMPLHWVAWRSVTARHGIHFPDLDHAIRGQPDRSQCEVFLKLAEALLHGGGDRPDLRRR